MEGLTATVPADLGGLTGLVVDVVQRLGEIGIGVLTLAETVFPPIPSEVILPLGGYLAQRGELNPLAVLLAATIGSVVGAWTLYGIGRRLGEERSAALVARLPLVDSDDVERAVHWFKRHGDWAVLGGRLMPGVRSLVSLPAGTAQMSLPRFTLLTTLGSLAWNGLLVGAGMGLGTQWELVEKYSTALDVAVVVALVVAVGLLVRRRLRRRSSERHRERAESG